MFDTKTNTLRYIFVPFKLLAEVEEDAAVIVEGYRRATILNSAYKQSVTLTPR